MHRLDLTENKLRIRGAQALSPCLKNVENLDLTKCLMVAEGTDTIAREIEMLEEPVTMLNVYYIPNRTCCVHINVI